PPWKPIRFQSGRTYTFPFRLLLNPVRSLNESLVRAEFAYVAENLLLRGGYRKTHFQADQTTLQNVSQMGQVYRQSVERIDLSGFKKFTPRYTFTKSSQPPTIYQFSEKILQAVIRDYLSNETMLQNFLDLLELSELDASHFEVLAEKAFPEGHVDILIKEATPIGRSRQIIIEVKKGAAKKEHINQLLGYMDEIREECIMGVLISRRIPKSLRKYTIMRNLKIRLLEYYFKDINFETNRLFSFNDLVKRIGFRLINS
ncbi:MAG: endonuclease NucS domain-containing protein, partial [Candidatus Asgardarchaeum sp.]